jgi:ABC-type uncharacterized transport system auxiliary subunit
MPGGPPPNASAIRLQPVGSTPFLRERMVWRASTVEYGLYEQRRWSELPSSYVQRALENALHDAGLRLTEDFKAPKLRVNVVAFDEVLAPEHVATVSLVVSLRDGTHDRLLDRTFSADAPISRDSPSATAVGMGHALDAVVAEVAAAVARQVRTG